MAEGNGLPSTIHSFVSPRSPGRMSLTSRVLLGLVTGLALGAAASAFDLPGLRSLAGAVEPLGTLWVNAIRMTVIPLVVSLLVTGIASASTSTVGRLGGRAVLLFVALVAVASAFTGATAPLLMDLLPLGGVDPARLAGGAAAPVEAPPFRDWLTALVPANAIQAAADGAMLPLIVFTAISALAAARTAPEQRALIVRLFEALRETMFVVVRWVLALAPFGVFFLILPLAARSGVQLVGALGSFLAAASALLVVGTLSLYPLARYAAGVPLRQFARACAPAQVVAFTTRSSLAALPAMVDGVERRLALPTQVTGLALPVAVSIFKLGSPIARIAGTLLVARLYGISLGPAQVAAITAALGLLSFYSPGIPSGGLLIAAPLYAAFGLPLEGLALLIALDVILDMFITVANVTGVMAAVAVLARGRRSSEPAPELHREAREPSDLQDAPEADEDRLGGIVPE